jgi:shikimate dehydrogenase
LIEEYIRNAIDYFEDTEGAALPQVAETRPTFAAVGSVAPKALASPLLLDRLAAQGVEAEAHHPYSELEDLLQNRSWSLALVLSPFKQAIKDHCDTLAASAERSGVIDTVIRSESGKRIGVNTNAMSAAWAMRRLMGGITPRRCLIAGTGASARSCIVGLRDLYEELEIGVLGRNQERTARIAEEFNVSAVENIEFYAPELVVNATTVGETSDEQTDFPLRNAFVAGVCYCVTMSGIFMQTIVNALRVHLLTRNKET